MELPILTAMILENYLKMGMFKFYEVGGKVRDELLGLTNKDIDYVAVPCEEALKENLTTCDMFQLLWEHLIAEKFEIFLVTPDCYTIRARFPEGYKYQGVADFVMARKEVGYIPGTRTPIVEPGNLYDDLLRRDFTVNALAKDPDTGEIIDYFGGLKDIKEKLLRTPLPPIITFDDDPLRILRGIRFSITKRLRVSEDMWQAMATLIFNRRFQEQIVELSYNGKLDDDELTSSYKRSLKTGAMFDARCFNIPKEEVTNCILWRQQDATRNSISSAGQAHFSHKQLEGLNSNQIQELLFQEKGINWNDYPTKFKRGSCCIKKYHQTMNQTLRSYWFIDNEIPIFKGEDREYIEKLIA